jgi:hypothetical protein
MKDGPTETSRRMFGVAFPPPPAEISFSWRSWLGVALLPGVDSTTLVTL